MNTVRLILLLLTIAGPVSARTWTDKLGRSVDAELVGVQNGAALLKKPDGKQITVKLASLSLADRKYISENKPVPTADTPSTSKKKFGFAKVVLKESSKAHPGDNAQRTQDLVIEFTDGKRSASEYNLRIAFVSGSPDGEVSPLAFRAPPGKAGFGNGHASYPLTREQLDITELTLPIPRYSSLEFMGYQLELFDGTTLVDKHYWENAQLLETISRKLLLDKDFWYKDVFE